jgi:hypothetical protein
MCPSQAFGLLVMSSLVYQIHTFCKELDTIFEVGMLSLPTPIHLGQKDLYALEAAVLLAKLWHHVDFQGDQPHSQQ